MRMLVRLVLGLFVLKAALASPRFSRQSDPDSYDENYEDNFEVIYDYEDGPTVGEPEVGTFMGLYVSHKLSTLI